MSAPVTRFERSARRLLRAYPRRWREVRGDELVGVLLDLAPAGAQRLDARSAADLLRGGLATRWREHPPLRPWADYRLFDRVLPEEHRAWARDDIEGLWYPVRAAWRNAAVAGLFVLLNPEDRGTLVAWLALVVGLGTLAPLGRGRRAAVRRHLDPEPGRLLYGGRLVIGDGPRPRVAARPALPAIAAAAAVLVMVAVVGLVRASVGAWVAMAEGVLTTGSGPLVDRAPAVVVVLVCAALAAALAAASAARRVRRHSRPPVPQPYRRTTGLGLLGVARLVVLTAALATPAVGEALGGIALGPGTVVGGVALVVGAVALAALQALPPGGDLALVDVWTIVRRDRPPLIDAPLPVLLPVADPRGVVRVAGAPVGA